MHGETVKNFSGFLILAYLLNHLVNVHISYFSSKRA